MAGEAVGQSFQHDGALAVAQQLQLTLHSVNNSQRIEAVNSLCMELGGADAGSDTSHNALTHGLAAGLVAHAVGVIEDVVQDGHAIGVGLPQSLVLVHCGEVQSFPNGTTGHGSAAPAQQGNAAMARAALQELGYSPAEIQTALKGADPNASTEELIRHALRAMVMKG